MTQRAALIVGASRGIGLGLAKELAGRGWHVFASQRTPSAELAQAAAASGEAIEIVTADVTEMATLEALAEQIGPNALDIAVINAGITGAQHQSVEKATPGEVAHVMMTNTVGPAVAGKILLPLVREGGTLAFTSSQLGSIAGSSGGFELYRMSKVAQNMLARGISEQSAKARGIGVLSLHPGWVKTDMGGPAARWTVAQSAHGLADVLEKTYGPGHRFLAFNGQTVPW